MHTEFSITSQLMFIAIKTRVPPRMAGVAGRNRFGLFFSLPWRSGVARLCALNDAETPGKIKPGHGFGCAVSSVVEHYLDTIKQGVLATFSPFLLLILNDCKPPAIMRDGSLRIVIPSHLIESQILKPGYKSGASANGFRAAAMGSESKDQIDTTAEQQYETIVLNSCNSASTERL
jgi:hypothetical protein